MREQILTKLLVGALCGLVSLPCLAGDWIAAGMSDNTDQFVDFSSIEKNGDVHGAWRLAVLNRSDDGTAYTLIWAENNCRTKKVRYVEYADYDLSGNNIRSGTDDSPWKRVTPGSIGEFAMEAVCKKKAPEIVFPARTPHEVADKVRQYRIDKGHWK